MGIPKFFRWCAERYPLVITPFQESPPPVDNLYLDMNGIIHNCTHPNDIDASRRAPTEREMAEAMFQYLEKIFQAIQPQQYFYLAVDGCAPRAKMNQQRQRRYRSGYEMMVAREEALKRGEDIPEEGDVFDSNCITPGTEFMVRVGEHFKYFLTMKVQQDSAWRSCKVIFSGQEEPGEGEHKIVDFIRRRKMQPDYKPNETHCMYGLDADLIMLALATHEPNFILLREVVTFSQPTKKEKERQLEDAAKGIKEDGSYAKPDTFVLFHIKLLREYLDRDVCRDKASLPNYDFERVVDDFVFMCIFIGNDFLPAIPTMAINDGAMTTMVTIYREHILSRGWNLVRGGKPNWNAVDVFLAKIGELELETLKARQEEEEEYRKRNANREDQKHDVGTVMSQPIVSINEYKEKFYGDKHGFGEGWKPRGQEMHDLKQHYVEGLMWVMEYYYQGPASWQWFYPHHYAPMASDLVNLTVHGSAVRFTKGEPFLPHQQLLAVLPPMSYRSIPKAYWPLLRSATSPLAKYFPEHLQIDREGARAPWEGVVLIPFIDEKVLRAAYESAQAHVAPEDKARNKMGPPTLFEYDGDHEPYTVTNPIFNELHDIKVRRTAFHPPPMMTFVPALCRGVRRGKEHMEGYATLASREAMLTSTFETGAINIFGRPSRKESLLLNFEEGPAVSADETAHLVGKEVWIGFPHYKRGRVSALVDRSKRLSARWDKEGAFAGMEAEPLTGEEFRQFKKDTEMHQSSLKVKCGFVLHNIDVLVYVNRFTGMRVSRKGRFVHQFSTKDTCYPLELVTPVDDVDMLEDGRNVERERDQGDFSRGAQVIYLGPDPKGHTGESLHGSVGFITDRDTDTCTLLVRNYTEPRVLPQSIADAASTENWMSIHDVADKLRFHLRCNINSAAVSQICGTITTSPQWGSYELGLCMKFSAKNLARVGLCKFVTSQFNPWYVGNANLFEQMEDGSHELGHHLHAADPNAGPGGGQQKRGRDTVPNSVLKQRADKGMWVFSRDAYDYIEEYCKRFLPLVKRVIAGGANLSQLEMPSVLTGPWAERTPDDVMGEMSNWLESHGLHTMPMVAASDDSFPAQILSEMEGALEVTGPRRIREVRMRRVVSRFVYYPTTMVNGTAIPVPLPVKDQKFAIGNRVVYCRTTGIVPFGMHGTIVRLLGDGKTAEVVYDEAFVGGAHLGGRLKTSRGGLSKLAALLVVSPTVTTGAIPDGVLSATTSPAATSPKPEPTVESKPKKDDGLPKPKSAEQKAAPKAVAGDKTGDKAEPRAPAPKPRGPSPLDFPAVVPRYHPGQIHNAFAAEMKKLLKK